MVSCVPSKLLSDIHYHLPHLSHVRFGGNFTDGSLLEILPGEIVVKINNNGTKEVAFVVAMMQLSLASTGLLAYVIMYSCKQY